MNEFNELYDTVMKLKTDINNITYEIEKKGQEFSNSIVNLTEELRSKQKELNEIKDYKVIIRLGDLIDELLKIFNLDKNIDTVNCNVSTSISYFGKKSKDEIIKLNNDSKYGLGYGKKFMYILIEGTKKTARYSYQPKSFIYSIFLPLDFEKIQADGKNLLEHSSIKAERDNKKKNNTIIIDKNVEDLILDIDLNTLLSVNKPNFYPANLFRNAVGNCYKKEQVKVKKRQP